MKNQADAGVVDINVQELAALLDDNGDPENGNASDLDEVLTEAQAAVVVAGPGTDTPNSVTMAAIKMARYGENSVLEIVFWILNI